MARRRNTRKSFGAEEDSAECAGETGSNGIAGDPGELGPAGVPEPVGATDAADETSPSLRLPAAKRREQLFDIALEHFSARGYHGTAMEEIAEAAGVTKPVLYQHFDSKRALYMELLEHVGDEMMQEITAAVSQAGSPRRQVESGFAAYFRFVDAHEDAFYLLFGTGGRRDDEFGEVVGKVEASMAEAVATLIEAGVGAVHRLMLAYGIVGLAESTSRQWLGARAVRAGASPSSPPSALPTAKSPAAGKGLDGVPGDPETLARWVAELAWAGLRGITHD